MNQPKVCIVILNWNGLEDTIECLESLKNITYPNYEVIIVDNGSDGNDTQVLEERFSDYIHLIKNDRNYGAYDGYNIGMKHALNNFHPHYLLLLDNDTVVDPEFLTEMVKVAETDPGIFIAGAKIYYYDKPDRLQYIGGKIGLWRCVFNPLLTTAKRILGREDLDRGQHDSIKEMEHMGFWCTLIRREGLESVGLFYGRPFNEYEYYADVDYFIRAKEAGLKIIYVPKAKVWHKYRTSNMLDGSHQYNGLRSRFRLMREHATRRQYCYFLIYFFGVYFWLATAYYLIWRRRPRMLVGFYKGVRDGLFHSGPEKSLED